MRAADRTGLTAKTARRIALFFCAALLIDARPAWAYVDPGAGSMLLQVWMGGMAGAAVLARLAWRRLRSVFVSRRPARDTSPGERQKAA